MLDIICTHYDDDDYNYYHYYYITVVSNNNNNMTFINKYKYCNSKNLKNNYWNVFEDLTSVNNSASQSKYVLLLNYEINKSK